MRRGESGESMVSATAAGSDLGDHTLDDGGRVVSVQSDGTKVVAGEFDPDSRSQGVGGEQKSSVEVHAWSFDGAGWDGAWQGLSVQLCLKRMDEPRG